MSVTLEIIPEGAKPQVRALLDRYLAELSVYGKVDPSYPYFEAYWREPGLRWPYFLRCHEAVIGFAFVRRLGDGHFSMAEFFIDHGARGKGHGVEAAARVMSKHPGRWELTIFEHNTPAQRFWPVAIAAASATQVSRTEERKETVYRFDCRQSSGPRGLHSHEPCHVRFPTRRNACCRPKVTSHGLTAAHPRSNIAAL
jgi:predicted acetyltransferase